MSTRSEIKKKPTLLSELREFLLDSTFVEWALGWIAGEVISRFLTSLVHDVLFPFLGGLFLDGEAIEECTVEFYGATICWGNLLINTVDMLIVLFAIFAVCQVICYLRRKHKLEDDSDDKLLELTEKNTELLSDIKDLMAKK